MSGSIDRRKGTVKWFDCIRGFGFISPEGGGPDIFVHYSSIQAVGLRALIPSEAVEFVLAVGDECRSTTVSVIGPGRARIEGVRYFPSVCFYCNLAQRGLGSCHGGGEIQSNLLNPLNLGSLSPPLPEKGETLEGQVSKEQSEDDEPKSGAEWRDWAELPRDILLIIFKKIAVAEILSSVQAVCRPWRQLSHETEIWRCVDLRMYANLDAMVSMVKMVVDRSGGCLEELYMGHFSKDELMHYIAQSATRLRHLHLVSVDIYEKTLLETLRKLPLLEELEISRCYCFSYEVIERVGEVCPQLKSFGLDDRVPAFPLYLWSASYKNVSALAIAKHFKQLRRLRLFANSLTNFGLLAILENCPYLEHLDIRCCFNIDSPDENLKNKCARLKDLRLPNDSIADYEYWVDEVVAEGSDINSHLSDTDYDSEYSDD